MIISEAQMGSVYRDVLVGKLDDRNLYVRDLLDTVASLREQVRALTAGLERERERAAKVEADSSNAISSRDDAWQAAEDLRTQVVTLTAENTRLLEADAEQAVRWIEATHTRNALRARVAEVERQRADEWLHIAQVFGAVEWGGKLDGLPGVVAKVVAERDAAQQRAKALEDALRETGHAIVVGTKEAREAAVTKALVVLGMHKEAP